METTNDQTTTQHLHRKYDQNFDDPLRLLNSLLRTHRAISHSIFSRQSTTNIHHFHHHPLPHSQTLWQKIGTQLTTFTALGASLLF